MTAANEVNARDPGARRRWWAVVALLFVLLATPGPERTPFSGMPFSSQTLILFVGAVLLAVFSAFFPARTRLATRWLVTVAILVAGKALLSMSPAMEGWHGSYWTFGVTQQWTQARFQGRYLAIEDHRVDGRLDFVGDQFALHFINDYGSLGERTSLPRDVHRPLHVRWTGHVEAAGNAAFATSITATGTVTIRIDGGEGTVLQDPDRQPYAQALTPGRHVIVITYEKPAGVVPRLEVTPPGVTVTPVPTSEAALANWAWRSLGATVVGVLALVLIGRLFLLAYAPVSVLALQDIWLEPKKIAALVFLAYFAAIGLQTAIGRGQSTVALTAGDDWLAYEGQARQVVFNSILMTDEHGVGKTFHHYPLYSYMLAAAHIVFGEEFASVMMFNYLSLGSIGFTVYFLLKRYVRGTILGVTLLLTAVYLHQLQRPYADTSFSDNLYLLVVMVTLAVGAAAFERPRTWLIVVTGVLSGLAAATRPSFLLFPPFFVLAVLADAHMGGFAQRLRHAIGYSAGFLGGVAPFTLRNWLVAHKFVLVVSSFIMLPYFLYPPSEPVPVDLFVSDSLGKSLGDFMAVWREHPARTAWVEVRKVLFTVGFVGFGPDVGIAMPRALWVWPLLFVVALWRRRIPRPLRRLLVVFALSHVAAMVVGAPWTYGYKTILPLHLALIVGAVFLWPDWAMEWWRARRPAPKRSLPEHYTVSVVLPTYNEKDSIRRVIEDFFATGLVTEVLVINNNAVPGTSEEVAGTGAREVMEPRQGYGAAIRRGLIEARGDVIVICEPDGTFLARDIRKLLAFADDFDVVYGSRTSQQFIWRGANMGVFLRWGNWAVAKYMEFLYNATSLTDVGCTMRLVRRDVTDALRDEFRIDGSQFGPEMMVLTLKNRWRVIQVPVNYLPRVGDSAVTGDLATAFVLGCQMIWLITARRLEGLGRRWWGPAPAAMPETTP